MPGLSDLRLPAEERAGALSAAPPAGSIRAIIHAVAEAFGVPVRRVLSKQQSGDVAPPRQVAMHLAVELTGKSIATIARAFDRDRKTVLHAHRVIPARCAADPDLAQRVAALRAALTFTPGDAA